MKKPQKTDIEAMIMGSHYLQALNIESQAQKPLSEMERQDYIEQINSLKETVEQFKEMIVLLKQAFASSEQVREEALKHNQILEGVISNLSNDMFIA